MPKPIAPSDRSFGYTFAVVFLLIGAWQAWAGRFVAASVLALLCAVTLAITLVRPSLLSSLNRAWMKFGALLHAVVNPIVLGGMYFLLITPVGIVMRLFGRDALKRRLDGEAASYWVERSPPGPPPDSLPHQF
jgi:hypothetical protein